MDKINREYGESPTRTVRNQGKIQAEGNAHPKSPVSQSRLHQVRHDSSVTPAGLKLPKLPIWMSTPVPDAEVAVIKTQHGRDGGRVLAGRGPQDRRKLPRPFAKPTTEPRFTASCVDS